VSLEEVLYINQRVRPRLRSRCVPPLWPTVQPSFSFRRSSPDERFKANAPVQLESDKGHQTALLSRTDAHKELGIGRPYLGKECADHRTRKSAMRLLAKVIQRLLYRRIATSHEALGRSLRAHVRDLNASTPSTSLSRLGGALIGLHFVVVTLVADRPSLRVAEAGAAFATPTR
jgi:hypothetical protein